MERPQNAVDCHSRAVQGFEKLGPNSADLALAVGNLSIRYEGLERLADAEKMLRPSVAIPEEYSGTKLQAAALADNLASVVAAQKRHSENIWRRRIRSD